MKKPEKKKISGNNTRTIANMIYVKYETVYNQGLDDMEAHHNHVLSKLPTVVEIMKIQTPTLIKYLNSLAKHYLVTGNMTPSVDKLSALLAKAIYKRQQSIKGEKCKFRK